MDETEKVLELLDKDTLSGEEKQYLSNALNNPELRKIKETYVRLKNSLKLNEHIDEELMADYVLYKNNLNEEKIIVLLANKVEDHLRRCAKCQELFKTLNSEYSSIDEFINNSITTKPAGSEYIKKFKFAFASIAAVSIIYLGLFIVSSVTTPDYKKSFLDGNDFYTSRGRASEYFQRGLDAIDNKKYDNAVKYLNEDIADNVDDETIFYSYFVLGITYVNKGEKDYLGLFESYNKEDVMKGIESFNKSIQLNTSGNFDNLKLDAHYYIAKAYLLIDDIPSAKEHFKIVVDGKGSYYKKAEALLKIL
jgi:tetratricopeptide (TPR) repeat protein